MKISEALRLVSELAMAFGRTMEGDTVKIWARHLVDLDHGLARDAVAEIVRTADRMPSIAEVRRRATASREERSKGWGDGWAEVKAEIRRVGQYREPVFSDPRTAAAVAALGWQSLCRSRLEDEGTHRAQFRQAWEGASRSRSEEKAIGGAPSDPRIGNAVRGLLVKPEKGTP